MPDRDAAPLRLHDLPPSRRGMALLAFQQRHRGIDAAEAAGRLSAILGIGDELTPEDFAHASIIRDASLARLLDPADIASLASVAARWSAPPERVIAEALKFIRDTQPPAEILFDAAALQL